MTLNDLSSYGFMIMGSFSLWLGTPYLMELPGIARAVLIGIGLLCIFLAGRYSRLSMMVKLYKPYRFLGLFGRIMETCFVILIITDLFLSVFKGHSTGWLVTLAGFIVMFAGAFTGSPYHRTMSGIEYEFFCADYLQRHGYMNVQVTQASNDYGADVIAYDNQGQKWVVQCKYYRHPVDNSAVQQVVAAMAHYRANRGMVITNNVLTENARLLAMENDIAYVEGLG